MGEPPVRALVRGGIVAPPSPSYRRQLSDNVTVTVEGPMTEVDPDVSDRPPARVVLSMPDSTADALAHLLAAWHTARALAEVEDLGPDERTLAEALYDAAASGGYHCPFGSPGQGRTEPRPAELEAIGRVAAKFETTIGSTVTIRREDLKAVLRFADRLTPGRES
jgi:hypothetical protein